MAESSSDLLAVLADGRWHSGATLGERFGVTRATIANRVAALTEQGFKIHRVTGRGYQLADAFEPLQVADIQKHLGDSLWQTIDVLPAIDSTNRWLADQIADKPATHPRACFAEQQTAGRGRRGKKWASPAGGNLYCSASWQYAVTPEPLPALAPSIAVGLVRILRQYIPEVAIKWPNDLWVEGRKIAGILIEHSGEFGGTSRLIIGVGVNYKLPDQTDIDQPATDLQASLAEGIELPSRNVLAAELLASIASVATRFGRGEWDALRQEWCEFDVLRDRVVDVSGAEPIQGVACGMDSLGRLQIDTGSGMRAVSAGDVSVRPASQQQSRQQHGQQG